MSFNDYLNFTPGPYAIPKLIQKAMLEEPPYFAGPDFCEYYSSFLSDLKRVCGATHDVVVGCGSGSMGLQAAVLNFIRPGKLTVIINNGKYGKLWYSMAAEVGAEVLCLQSKVGHPTNEKRLETCLRLEGHKIKFVLMQHVETTTGLRNPIERYCKMIREKSDAVIMIDAVSSFMVEEINPDLYDVVVGASQKGFQCPPGMFFMFISEKAKQVASSGFCKLLYFDVINELKRCSRGITTFTPPTVLIQAMRASIRHIEQLGIAYELGYMSKVSEIVKKSISETFELIPTDPEFQATGVTCFRVSELDDLYNYLYARKIVVGDGIGEDRGKLIRIGHMGWNTNMDGLRYVLDVIKNKELTK